MSRSDGWPLLLAYWEQPICDIETGEVVGREWLVRSGDDPTADGLWDWAEQARAIAALERQILDDLARWRPKAPGGRWFVNLHPRGAAADAAAAPDLWRSRAAALAPVVWELLETPGWGEEAVLALAGTAEVALDDWGEAPEASSRMATWPVRWVKLDMRLIHEAAQRRGMGDWIRAVAAFAAERGAQVIAEGVETSAHIAVAHELGLSLCQGQAIAAPRRWAVVPCTAAAQRV